MFAWTFGASLIMAEGFGNKQFEAKLIWTNSFWGKTMSLLLKNGLIKSLDCLALDRRCFEMALSTWYCRKLVLHEYLTENVWKVNKLPVSCNKSLTEICPLWTDKICLPPISIPLKFRCDHCICNRNLLHTHLWSTRISPFTKKSYLHRTQWTYYF